MDFGPDLGLCLGCGYIDFDWFLLCFLFLLCSLPLPLFLLLLLPQRRSLPLQLPRLLRLGIRVMLRMCLGGGGLCGESGFMVEVLRVRR